MLPGFLRTAPCRVLTVPRLAAGLLLAGVAGLLSPAPARADLAIGAAAPFDPVRIRAVRSQEDVAAADNGAVTLFAWTDRRSGSPDVYAARVAHDGTVLDPNGIAVAVSGADESAPTVSWNGTNWLVAFERGNAVYAARVAADGEVLDPSPFAILDGPFTDGEPAAVGLGANHLVVWTQSDLNSALMGALVDSDGNFDVAPMALSVTPPADFAPAVARRGTTALVGFVTTRNGDSDVYAFRLERSTAGPPTLVRLDPADVAVAIGPARVAAPAVAASANGWLVAWQDERNANTTGTDIWAARVNAAGAVLDAGGFEVVDDAGDDRAPAATHTGAGWLVAWSQEDVGQFLRAVADNGNPAAPRIDVSTAAGTLGRAAFGGAAATPLVAWSDPEAGSSGPKPPQDLLGRVVAANLSLGAAFPIATQSPNQTQPTMSFGANRWLVAWVDDRFGPTEGRLRYAVTDGATLAAPAPASIGWVAERAGLDQAQPAACFDGTNFNLVWTEERGGFRRIVGARFTTGGAFIDTFTVAADPWNHTEPTVVHGGDGHVAVVWTDSRLPADRDLWGRLVVSGAVTGAETPIAQTAGVHDEKARFAPRVVDPGDGYVYVVYQKRSGPDTGSIHGRFVETEVLAALFEDTIRNDAGRVYESPQIAWNGEQFLVTFQELVANDGPGLYIPWAVWLNGVFQFISFPLQVGPGSYVPANPIVGSAGYNFVTLRSRLAGSQVDLDLRRANAIPEWVDADPIPYTADPGVDVPGAALQGQGDRVGLLHLEQQDDAEWNGLRLFGAEARDTLEGRVVLNEFLANPAEPFDEFYEMYNVSGQRFQLEGWYIAVDGESTLVSFCNIGAPGPAPGGGRTPPPAGDVLQGTPCGVIESDDYRVNYDFFGIPESPTEGHLPNRGALIELFTPGGVKVDQVAYGFRGGAPVSPPIPLAQAPAARGDRSPLATQREGAGGIVAAPGDSVDVTTARLPDGDDTNSDANDFNLTTNSTPGSPNTGQAAALGSKLFVARAFWNPSAGDVDAIELFNPSLGTFDFAGWYLGSNDGTQRIGIAGNAWSVLESLDKRTLRRDEPGSFTTDLDYLTVVYLLDENFARVEQIGWSRPDNLQPEMCLKREPDTGGFHDGFDWFTSGGEQNPFTGQLRYVACELGSPDGSVDAGGAGDRLAFRGAVPNPAPAGRGALVFTVPGAPGGPRTAVRLRLVDVAGRVRATMVDEALAPGEHRLPLPGATAAGIYYARLELGGQKISRPVVVLP